MDKITAKILVVEDEMIIAADISMMLERLGYEVTGITPRGEDALKSIEATRPDLILMDIALKGALDGVQIAQIVREKFQIPFIFLTANADDDTFNRAKTTKPQAFLSKPFRQSELQRAIELALENMEIETAKPSFVENEPGETTILADRIFVRHKEKMVKIMLSEIIFAEADRNYCKIHTTAGEFLLTVPLGSFEERLRSPDFLRIHRSHIINVTKIDAIHDNFGFVSLGKHNLPVSRGFQDVLAARLRVV